MGGVFTKIIEKNTTIPTKASQVFSTAEDNQSAVTVHVLQGEREQARFNKSLAKFDLSGIEPAPRGLPQVEVSFDIDANGILHVSAKDKKTNKEQKVEIKAGSGLSEEEIARMVADAEANREEDKKFQELVQARNQADALIHGTRSAITEHGSKVGGDVIGKVEAALADLETAMKGDDKAQIEAKSKALEEAGQSLFAAASADQGGARVPMPAMPARATMTWSTPSSPKSGRQEVLIRTDAGRCQPASRCRIRVLTAHRRVGAPDAKRTWFRSSADESRRSGTRFTI